MNNFYTFLVTSTINSNGVIVDSDKRLQETIKTIDSIHNKVDNVKIIFIDNSIEPLTEEQIELIKPKVDIFHTLDHTLVSLFFNKIYSKGMGEIYLMYELIKLMERNDLVGKRIFKLSGRYNLADSFDITQYENTELHNKYVCRINEWDVFKNNEFSERVFYFETRLWSFCSSLLDEYKSSLLNIFHYMVTVEQGNIEKSYLKLIDHDKIVVFKPIHVEGYNGENGIYRFE